MINYKLHEDSKRLSQKIYPENRQIDSNGWKYQYTKSGCQNVFYSAVLRSF